MVAPPARTSISDAYPNPSNAVMREGMGALYDFIVSLLGNTGDPVDARAALGVGNEDGLVHKTGDEEITGVKTFTDSPVFPQSTIDEYQWLGTAVGCTIELRTDLAGVVEPPMDNPKFRYIKLTASDTYNDGVLISESVTGSAPTIEATAVIDFAASPMNGDTVELINTSRYFVRPGSSGTKEQSQNASHTHTATQAAHSHTVSMNDTSGTTYPTRGGSNSSPNTTTTSSAQPAITVNASGGTESRPRSIGANYYMRIQ